ncbi:MAG: hypothetical protein COB02_09955 [Candidatus Cloacimonadota bacterium]|nr:MAG: hypothetical protein COB02_09955 [Candidatus Cloacimonadota bacterium]
MAKKKSKRNQKKGLDQRDYMVYGVYALLFLFIVFSAFVGKGNQKEKLMVEAQKKALTKEKSKIKSNSRKLERELKVWRARRDESKSKLSKEKNEYDFVVGTSLEYAKKNKLLMAIWESIDKVRNLAIASVTVAQNEVDIVMHAQSDVYLTEFMSELNRRKDIIQTIQIVESRIEVIDKKVGKEVLLGILKIIAKRPNIKNKLAKKLNKKSVEDDITLKEEIKKKSLKKKSKPSKKRRKKRS